MADKSLIVLRCIQFVGHYIVIEMFLLNLCSILKDSKEICSYSVLRGRGVQIHTLLTQQGLVKPYQHTRSLMQPADNRANVSEETAFSMRCEPAHQSPLSLPLACMLQPPPSVFVKHLPFCYQQGCGRTGRSPACSAPGHQSAGISQKWPEKSSHSRTTHTPRSTQHYH